MKIDIIDWGLIDYTDAYKQQKQLFDEAIVRKHAGLPVENKLILCEHPHVITIGKNGQSSNLLFPEQSLQERRIALFRVDRGGDVTYHGPGQLVGYPIFDLDAFSIGLKEYIRRLEEVIITVIGEYGLRGERLSGATGVWLDATQARHARKIAAIGVRSSRYVTMHGFALNVNTDLSYFRLINPCGFTDKGVTSIRQETGKEVDMSEVKQLIVKQFNKTFPLPPRTALIPRRYEPQK